MIRRELSIPCFSCGRRMRLLDRLTGWCDRCQVMEERLKEPYVCRTREVTSAFYWDQEIRYVDHAAEHHPSPA